MTAIFMTGTDTGIGKTFVSCLLLKALNRLELQTFAIKPIASGCEQDSTGQLINDDARQLQRCASIKRAYSVVNPIAFEPPIAPCIAADERGLTLSTDTVRDAISNSMQAEADVHIIEGVGGWAQPLDETALLSDVISELNMPVILVVGIRLGCLNHALLTYQHILAKKVPCLGWIANCLTPTMLSQQENINTLRHWIKAPCLGVIPYGCQSAECINVSAIQDFLSNGA